MKKRYFFLIAIVVVAAYALISDRRLGGGADPQKTDPGFAEVAGRQVRVKYVSKDWIYPAFGLAFLDTAEVRSDLNPRVKRFVRAHELYHLGDSAKWGGWIGREIRANVACGLVDPTGLTLTIFASLNRRLLFYWDRFKRGW
ncbi:MAG: hypothetical protein AAB871_00950 [Patescibacteria group bacterium]